MTRLLTTRALDTTLRRRAEDGAQGFRLTPSCHRAAGVDLTYLGAGVVQIACHRCHREVARLAVAGGQLRGREDPKGQPAPPPAKPVAPGHGRYRPARVGGAVVREARPVQAWLFEKGEEEA